MKVIGAYKVMEPTYAELAKALKSLGFIDKSTERAFVYVHQHSDAMVLLPPKKANDNVMRAQFAALSYNLMGQGVIKHEYDLGKMIEKSRLQEQNAAA